jgi:hypothetical protein
MVHVHCIGIGRNGNPLFLPFNTRSSVPRCEGCRATLFFQPKWTLRDKDLLGILRYRDSQMASTLNQSKSTKTPLIQSQCLNIAHVFHSYEICCKFVHLLSLPQSLYQTTTKNIPFHGGMENILVCVVIEQKAVFLFNYLLLFLIYIFIYLF